MKIVLIVLGYIIIFILGAFDIKILEQVIIFGCICIVFFAITLIVLEKKNELQDKE